MLPRRPTGPAGLSDRRLAGTKAPSFALVGRRASRNAGANVLGGEIKGEASAAGRRRRTFAPQGIRPRRPAVLRTKRFSPSREKNQEKIGTTSGRERGLQYCKRPGIPVK